MSNPSLPRRADYRTWIEAVLAESPDSVLTRAGFRRYGLVFSRTESGVKQQLRFDLVVRPSYARGAAQLVLDIHFSVPAADRIYEQSVAGLSEAPKRYFINEPGDAISRKQGGIWLFTSAIDAFDLEPDIAQKLEQDVIPFVNERSTPVSLANAYQRRLDEAVLRNEYRYEDHPGDLGVFLAAVYESVGLHEDAQKVLNLWYPRRSRWRTRYQPVLTFYGIA